MQPPQNRPPQNQPAYYQPGQYQTPTYEQPTPPPSFMEQPPSKNYWLIYLLVFIVIITTYVVFYLLDPKQTNNPPTPGAVTASNIGIVGVVTALPKAIEPTPVPTKTPAPTATPTPPPTATPVPTPTPIPITKFEGFGIVKGKSRVWFFPNTTSKIVETTSLDGVVGFQNKTTDDSWFERMGGGWVEGVNVTRYPSYAAALAAIGATQPPPPPTTKPA